jgi:hypothetical protein
MEHLRNLETPLLRAWLLSTSRTQVAVSFSYNVSDPYAVRLTIASVGAPVIWTIARELIAVGLQASFGPGEVVVAPALDGPDVLIGLVGVGGSAVLSVPHEPLRKFLDDTYREVPVGNEPEHLDIDGLVAHLLAA